MRKEPKKLKYWGAFLKKKKQVKENRQANTERYNKVDKW